MTFRADSRYHISPASPQGAVQILVKTGKMMPLLRRMPYLRWTEFALPLFAVVLAVATTVAYGPEMTHFGDAGDYAEAAVSLLNDGSYPRQSSLPFFRAPLYPLLIAAIWRVAPLGSYAAIKVVQAALFGMTCWFLFRIGLKVTGERGAAGLGALVYAVNPFALLQTAEIQSETLHTTLLAAGVLLLTVSLYQRSPTTAAAFGAGFAFGLAALCRPTALPVGLALALCVLTRGRAFLKRLLQAVAVILGIATAVLPWTYCNWNTTGEPIVISDGLGYTLWLGNHPAELRVYEGRFRDKREFNEYTYNYLQQALPAAMIAGWEESGGYSALSLMQREQRWRSAAIATMRAEPLLTLRLWADKTWAFWRPWLRPTAYSPFVVLASGVAVSLLYVLAAAGVYSWSRDAERRRFLLILGVLFATSTSVHTVTLVMIRYRLPYVDPYLSVLAGSALVMLASVVPCPRRPSNQGM